MKYLTTFKISVLLIGLFISNIAICQHMETMLVEKMDPPSFVFPEECTPEDMIIVINSSVPNLEFESNMLPTDEFNVIYNEKDNQYFICHEKRKFILTISGPNLQAEDVNIFDIEKPLAFRVTTVTVKGTVTINTNPGNATIIIPDFTGSSFFSNQPITIISGKFKAKIFKPKYKNVDTVIVVPSDAEKTYKIDLVPLFSRIKLDLRTDDNAPFLKAPVMWIDSVKIELEALVKPGAGQRTFFEDVEFLKFYVGNIIPIEEGTHKIRIEAESYIPYETTLLAKNGKLHPISVSLEPIFGYLTFVDKQFSEGATIFINNQKIGNVPLFKVKTRVGTHKIKFVKPGYTPLSQEYTVVVEEKKVTDFDVTMLVARTINFVTDPPNAEVVMDGNRIGFTPTTSIANAGNHEIVIRKSGFATEKMTKLISEKTPDEETVKLGLRAVSLLNINSEREGLQVNIKGKKENENIAIEEKFITPANIPLPFGKYNISLGDGKKTYYRSTVNHIPQITRRGKLPYYSRSSFRLLEANIGLTQKSGDISTIRKIDDIDNFEVSFGRIVVFPNSGLSSALLNVDYKLIETDSISFKTLAPNIFFLNWDWRIGGSVLRQLDVNFLGKVKYTQGLMRLGVRIPGFADVEMLNYFYGIEVSTRLSYFNINFRTGMQVRDMGKLNYWAENDGKYGYFDKAKNVFIENKGLPIPKLREEWIGSIGITLNGKVSGSNQMLRLWNKPFLDPAKRKTRIKDVEPKTSKINEAEPSKPNFLSKLKFWEKIKLGKKK
jgi:hypothetical protein